VTREPALPFPDLPELTSARFFAALSVILSHLSYYLHLPAGMSWMLGGGVSFFFVLSGFILTYRYWEDFAAGVGIRTYRNFFVARVARIYPSHALALVLITLLYLAIARLSPGTIPIPGNTVTSWLVNLFALQTFAFSYPTQQNWNGPSWSVSTEMAFYVVCPFILAALARHARGTRALVIVFVGAAAFGAAMQSAMLWLVFKEGWNPDFWLDIVASRNIAWRIPEFLAGVVAARLLYGGHLRILGRRPARDVLFLASLLAVVVLNAAPWPEDRTAMLIMRQYRLDIGYMLPFAGIVLALGAGPMFLSPLLTRPFLVFLGSASYGIYIYHWIAVVAVSHAVANGVVLPPAAVAAAVVGVILFSAISYVAFERPLRKAIRAAFAAR
jgi:peptidoglycan/LPS O-acetylase OafA/YrhL